MTWPEAEFVINEATVRSLLARQFPEYADAEILEVDAGFDNSLWRVGDDRVARLPRRAIAVELLIHELRWLDLVTAPVTLRTPAPLRAGIPDAPYPWPWALATWIDGEPGDTIDLDQNDHNAATLATFLRELHQAPPADAPVNPFRSVPLSSRRATNEGRLRELALVVDATRARRILDVAEVAPDNQRVTWLHGDVHPANTLYSEGTLVGVVDFGDLCAGDPATDLAGALMSLPARALSDFFEAYGSADVATRRRTLGWAVTFGLMMVSLGLQARPRYLAIGQRALENASTYANVL